MDWMSEDIHHDGEQILAIDVGTQTGFSMLEGGRLTAWTTVLEGVDGSHKLLAFWNYLKWYRPDLVVYERPFAQGAAKRQLDSYVTAIELWAMTNDISWIGVAPSTLKKSATGNGRAHKYEVIAAMRERFPATEILDDNQADAVALIDYLLKSRATT